MNNFSVSANSKKSGILKDTAFIFCFRRFNPWNARYNSCKNQVPGLKNLLQYRNYEITRNKDLHSIFSGEYLRQNA